MLNDNHEMNCELLMSFEVDCLGACKVEQARDVEEDGAQLRLAAVWVRLKQCLHLETFT